MSKRVGIVALLHESNTFLSEPTTLEHFKADVLCSGGAVLDTFRGSQHEVGGFIAALEATADVEMVGIFAARAIPYGTITEECWESLVAQLLSHLDAAGPLDGILVAPHGAAVAEHQRDADGDWLTRLRHHVGPELPIIGTLDLHANVSPRMAEACNALMGYRTNPHLDQRARGLEAGELMLRTLRGDINPTQVLIQLPLCINIERQATEEPHGRKLWSEADRFVKDTPGLLSASLLYGFPYADVEEMGACVLAVSDGDAGLARRVANELASHWWAMQDAFVGEMISVDEAIAMARGGQGGANPVGLLDMGDNVGGGSAGDGTVIAHAWARTGEGPLLVILFDPEAVQKAEQVGIGNRSPFRVGGKTDDRHGTPIEDNFTIVSMSDGKFSETQPRHGGYSHFDQGRTAVLRSDAGLTIIATSRRVGPMSLQQVLSQGVEPSGFAAIVIKGVHAPVAAYAPVCCRLIRVNTPGATCADLSQFEFEHRRRPIFPFENAARSDT